MFKNNKKYFFMICLNLEVNLLAVVHCFKKHREKKEKLHL